MLVDLDLDGKTRKVLLHTGRNGFMYVIDRQTGEVLSADPYDAMTAYKGVDLKTGRIIPNEDLKPDLNRTARNVCPARRPARRIGNRPRGRRARIFSTFRINTYA